jgi:hypothetical protein
VARNSKLRHAAPLRLQVLHIKLPLAIGYRATDSLPQTEQDNPDLKPIAFVDSTSTLATGELLTVVALWTTVGGSLTATIFK